MIATNAELCLGATFVGGERLLWHQHIHIIIHIYLDVCVLEMNRLINIYIYICINSVKIEVPVGVQSPSVRALHP